MRKQPIRIAGAGPAGMTAEINLRKVGIDVEVYEKRSDAGKRFHGHLQVICPVAVRAMRRRYPNLRI